MPVIDYAVIRQDVIESLKRYVDHRIETGGFLRAVLENNLREACGRADEDNAASLFQIVAYCYNEIPGSCWGSPERVKSWLQKRGEVSGE